MNEMPTWATERINSAIKDLPVQFANVIREETEKGATGTERALIAEELAPLFNKAIINYNLDALIHGREVIARTFR